MVPARLSVLLRMANPLRYFAPEYMLALAPEIEAFLSFES
jgi:hypothetical protein